MFPGRLREAHLADVAAGLPSLNREMVAGQINTPPRIAAFLTTLIYESWCEYNVHEVGDTRVFGGRGYIQLTGQANYDAASKYLNVDLVSNPDLAMSLEWSARIARWYWTVARSNCNAYADALRMGKINAAIGYPRSADGSNDNARCATFAKALAYLTGEQVVTVDCNR